MKIQLLLPDLVTLLEVVDEHISRYFPGVDPPLPLKKVRTKLIHLARMNPREAKGTTAGSPRQAKTGKTLRKRSRQSTAAVQR
jgi:hypothetical protein